MRPTEILMQQADLQNRLTNSKIFRNAFADTAGQFLRDASLHTKQSVVVNALVAVEQGETYLITEDMVDVVRAASEVLDDSDTFQINMLPSKHGVVRFAKPFTFEDARGSECKVHWLMWATTIARSTSPLTGREIVHDVVQVSIWNDLADADDIGAALLSDFRRTKRHDATAAIGRWSAAGVWLQADGRRMGPPERDLTDVDIEQAQKVSEDIERLGGSVPHVKKDAKAVNLTRVMWAMVLLMGQETVTKTRSTHSKAETKVLARNGAHESLQVVTLRRRSHGSTGASGSSYEYDHRWLCRGHFAWRKCGDKHPMAQEYSLGYRARVWVAPYVKGPEGAPIKTTKKVYKLAR